MNGRLPVVTAGEVVRALERAGFVVVRSSGSHHRLVHRDDPTRATCHAGKILKRWTVRGILRQAGLTVDEFRALL
jgi:predicted RNA binding protein YcfA (HicA-like mRNA interferase family)